MCITSTITITITVTVTITITSTSTSSTRADRLLHRLALAVAAEVARHAVEEPQGLLLYKAILMCIYIYICIGAYIYIYIYQLQVIYNDM